MGWGLPAVPGTGTAIVYVPSRGHPTQNDSAPRRVVSRGKLSNQASDYGGLEVFGGASIGHTDPWAVGRALDAVLQRNAAQ